MNWLIKIAGPQQKIQQFHIQSPTVQSFIHKYERLIPWNTIKNEQDVQAVISQQLLPQLYQQIDPESEKNVYTKNIDVKREVQLNNNNPEVQRAYEIYLQDPEGGQRAMLEAVNKPKRETFERWINYITGGNNIYKEDPAFQYVVFAPLVRTYGEKTKQSPLSLNPEMLAGVYQSLSENPQINVLKQYRTLLLDKQVASSDLGGPDGWLRIPSKENDPENFKANVARLRDLSCGNGWCTAQGMEEPYLKQGDFWLLIENSRAVIAIKLLGSHKVDEIRGRGQGQDAASHWEQVLEFLQNSNFDYENNSQYQDLLTGKKIKEQIDGGNLKDVIRSINGNASDIHFLPPEYLDDPEVLAQLDLTNSYMAFEYAKAKKGKNVPEYILLNLVAEAEYAYEYANQVLGGQNVPDVILQGISQSQYWSFNYARTVLGGQNVPDIILQSMATNSNYSFDYARFLNFQNLPPVIIQGMAKSLEYSYSYAKELKWQDVPPVIIQRLVTNPKFAYYYARESYLKGKIVPYETIRVIAEDPLHSLYYATTVLAPGKLEVPDEIVAAIASSPQYAHTYAINFLRHDGQSIPDVILRSIASNITESYDYAKELIKIGQEVPPEIIQGIAVHPASAHRYALRSLSGQNVPPEILQSISRDPELAFNYGRELNWNVQPEIIQSIINNHITAYRYAEEVLNWQNIPPEIIQIIATDPYYSFDYAVRVLKGRNVPDIITQSIAKNSEKSYSYAERIFNWENVPPIIMQSILEGRPSWYVDRFKRKIPTPEEVQIIANNPDMTLYFVRNAPGRYSIPPEIEQAYRQRDISQQRDISTFLMPDSREGSNNWLVKVAQSVSVSLNDYPDRLKEFLYKLSDSSQSDPETAFSRQEADAEMNNILTQTRSNANVIVQLVQQAISNISWNGSPVVVEVDMPPEERYGGPNYLIPAEDASIIVGGNSGWGGPSSFTLFMNDGQPAEIDDILEAGDGDFFTDPKIEQDYFNLAKELKYPGSGKNQKTVTLYTARPVEDRSTYENAQAVPSNLFMTTSYDRAEGIGMDLGGSSGVRDIWKVRIEQKYLMETLNTGTLRDYQVIGDGMVPVKGIQLISPGGLA
jgi:hypothetical protein